MSQNLLSAAVVIGALRVNTLRVNAFLPCMFVEISSFEVLFHQAQNWILFGCISFFKWCRTVHLMFSTSDSNYLSKNILVKISY